MKLYFASAIGREFNHPRRQKELRNRIVPFMCDEGDGTRNRYFNNPEFNVIIDQGMTFTWNRGITVDCASYTKFCLEHFDSAELIYSPVVRPGRPGLAKISLDEINRAAAKNFENYEYMLDSGIPAARLAYTFHQGEDKKWLKQAVNRAAHIALFPYFGDERSKIQAIEWLHECMTYALDKRHRPIAKLHGITNNFNIMKLFPWETVYYTNYDIHGGHGNIYVPRKHRGSFDYSSVNPELINVESVGGLSGMERNLVEEYLGEVGVALGEVGGEVGACNSRPIRQFLNAYYINMFAKTVGDITYQKDRPVTIFGDDF